MHRRVLLLITAATALLLLLLPLPPTASSFSAGNSLSNCNRTFSCSPLVNVSYLFTGGDCPAHCGPPEFHLSCIGDYPELTAGSLTYHVQALNETSRSLTLSRTDLNNGDDCLQQYANTTLNSTIFTFASDSGDLTLFYECSNLTDVSRNNLFSCKINWTETDNCYLIGAVPTDPILNGSKCKVSITVPILPFSAITLTTDRWRLREAVLRGFEVNYTNPYEDQCVMCGGIGGECGFDSDQGKPICICGDQICSTSRSKPIRTVGGACAIGASISTIAIFTWKLLLFKNKKDREVEQLIGILGSLVPRRYQ